MSVGEYTQDVPTLAAPPTIQNALLGPCQAGYQVQFILFGIFVQQIVSYGEEFRSHSKLARSAIAAVLALNIVYTAICFEDGYNSAAKSDRSVILIMNGSALWQFLPFFNGLIGATTEAFLTLRAGAFFSNKRAKLAFYIWQCCLIILVLFGSTASLAQGLIGFYQPYTEEKIPYNTAAALWLWAAAAADLSISIALAHNLRQRIAHFNDATDSTLRRLIMIGLRTAAFTSILSIVAAVLSSIYSGWDPTKTAIPVAFWAPTGALYGISLFTTLSSSREAVQSRLGGAGGGPSNSQNTNNNNNNNHKGVKGVIGIGGYVRHSRSISSSLGGIGRGTGGSTGGGTGGGGYPRRPPNVVPLAINVHREIVRDVDSEKSDEDRRERSTHLSFV